MQQRPEFSETEYNQEIEAIFKRFPSVQKASFKEAYKPGLDRMIEFDSILGHPSSAFRTIHVAGTNGKGSVANMLTSCLSASGVKTGLYTSPHIVDFRERMRIASPVSDKSDGSISLELVPKEYVFDFIKRWKDEFERLDLSFFEITTALAFKWFADSGVDTAVVEVGLGGRLDSTNIVEPILSIVTSIGLDHCDLLGDTFGKIAGEKAGIFKKNIPALIGESLPETEPVFVEKAKGTDSKLYFAERMKPTLWYKKDFLLDGMDLGGQYQAMNLRTVLAALDILTPYYPGLASEDNISKAIVHTATRMDFHGRWEKLSYDPFVICDIGHNAPALKNNFAQLDRMLSEGECSSLIIVYAVMADKDFSAIMPLMPKDATYIFTTPSTARSLPSDVILGRYKDFCLENGRPVNRLYAADTVADAIRMAVNVAGMTDPRQCDRKAPQPLIYIGGSTFAVSEAVPFFASKM